MGRPRCRGPARRRLRAEATLRAQFAAGSRVVAVASRDAPELTIPTPADENDLTLVGFLIFLDRPKAAAAASLARLDALGITVKVCTGDNPLVAQKVCAELGLVSGGTLTGAEITGMDDDALSAAARTTTIFARVSPEQKARLITLLRRRDRAVWALSVAGRIRTASGAEADSRCSARCSARAANSPSSNSAPSLSAATPSSTTPRRYRRRPTEQIPQHRQGQGNTGALHSDDKGMGNRDIYRA